MQLNMATTFTRFSQLPMELRLGIFDMAADLEHGNIIEVYFDRRATISRKSPGKPWKVI
jgi:2EXR family